MKTERLYLNLITEKDADFLNELMNTEKWHEFIGDRGIHSKEDAIQYMEDRMDPDLNKKGFINHVMIEKETSKAVGTCSLHNREGVDGMDIGYALLPTSEGKGYASEGAKAMIKLAFTDYQQQQISAITTDLNISSWHILQKLGFIHKGYIQLPNSSERIRLYVLEKGDWVTIQVT
ncbi:GNAT family N-acetyltransferase [Ekhidna sp.]